MTDFTAGASGNHTAGVSDDVDGAMQASMDRSAKVLETMFGERFMSNFMSPYLVLKDHVIKSPTSIRFFKKDFKYLSRQLYLEYRFRSWYQFPKDRLDRYAEMVSTKLEAIDTMMGNHILRLQKLLEQRGRREELMLWPLVFKADVPIIASQARLYIDVLSKLDELLYLTGQANLVGVIDSKQRAEAEWQAKRAIRAFRTILEGEVSKLYREGERVVAEQRTLGSLDPTMAQAVEQQGKDIAEFAKTSKKDDDDEPNLRMDGADPEQVIAEASAQAAAAAAAVTKKSGRGKSKTAAPQAATVGDGEPGAASESNASAEVPSSTA